MRVLFGLSQSEPAPSPRYRVLQFLPTLERNGFDCTVIAAQSVQSTEVSIGSVSLGATARGVHWSRTWAENQTFLVRVLRLLPSFDRVLLHRIPLSAWAMRLLTPHREKLIYDFDDALDAVPRDGSWPDRLRGRVWRATLERAVRCCHIVTTSNERNAQVIRALGGRAEILPTCVDVARYAPGVSHSNRERVVLGWIGTPSTAPYLASVEEPLTQVVRAAPVEVRLVGAGRDPFRALEATLRPWRLGSEVADTLGFDIGLMPMPDTPWSRGKAALKALQYGAARLPTVASWTETNQQILGTDEGAALCRTPDEWTHTICRLVSDAGLRTLMGVQGHARVRKHFSVEVIAPRLIALLRE